MALGLTIAKKMLQIARNIANSTLWLGSTQKQFCTYFARNIGSACHFVGQYTATVHSVTPTLRKQVAHYPKKE